MNTRRLEIEIRLPEWKDGGGDGGWVGWIEWIEEGKGNEWGNRGRWRGKLSGEQSRRAGKREVRGRNDDGTLLLLPVGPDISLGQLGWPVSTTVPVVPGWE